MKSWFESLEARERLFVVAAGVMLAIAVFYLAVWMPLDRGERYAATNVEGWRGSLAEIELLKGDLQAAASSDNTQANLNQSLVVIIDNTLRERGLYNSLQRSQPTATQGIRVEFENVAFDELILWLGDLGSSYGLQVESGSFSTTAEDSSGRVNATLTLER
ncbi:MAG: type II secretion system protein GspM [Woeseiaceae bacterium]